MRRIDGGLFLVEINGKNNQQRFAYEIKTEVWSDIFESDEVIGNIYENSELLGEKKNEKSI